MEPSEPKNDLIDELIKQSENAYQNEKWGDYPTMLPLEKMKEYPHIFLLGAVMDRQIDADRAWDIPQKIAREEFNNNFSFSNFEKQSLEWYISVFSKYSLHRFIKTQAEYFYDAVQKIKNEYNGNASNIWNNTPSCAEVIRRLRAFNGVGPKIATMVPNILTRYYNVPLKDFSSIDISADVQVMRVFYRLGLVDDKNDTKKTIKAAREIHPEFPGLLDLFCWKLGSDGICSPNKCGGESCPMNVFCPQQGLSSSTSVKDKKASKQEDAGSKPIAELIEQELKKTFKERLEDIILDTYCNKSLMSQDVFGDKTYIKTHLIIFEIENYHRRQEFFSVIHKANWVEYDRNIHNFGDAFDCVYFHNTTFTPKDLYYVFKNFNDKTIIFDADSILRKLSLIYIIEGAVCSSPDSCAKWPVRLDGQKEFLFTGSVIILTNQQRDKFTKNKKYEYLIRDMLKI